MSRRMLLWVPLGAVLGVLTLAAILIGVLAYVLLPPTGQPVAELRLAGQPLSASQPLAEFAQSLAAQFEQRSVRLLIDSQPPRSMTLRQLGVRVDLEALQRRALAVGHSGSVLRRLDETMQAHDGSYDIPLTWHIDSEALFSQLIYLKDDLDQPATPAKFNFKDHTVVGHKDGSYLDLYATLDALDQAVRVGAEELRVARTSVPPVVSATFLENIDITQAVGHFETQYGYRGGQANRAQNISNAASKLDGAVLMPGQVLSFNDVVGHRTLENGFRKGWEIFKGEMVEGVGGGTCQVASTLHAAAFLSGFEVVERSPHSRPSGYIPMGLDATVVDGLVDLKLRNPYAFPVVVHSIVEPGKLSIELLGQQRPAAVTFRSDVLRTQHYKRKLTTVPGMDSGKVIRKQRGIMGYTLKRTRLMRYADGHEREEVTTDIYPPTVEILLVPPDIDPDKDLPPLPGDKAAAEPTQATAADSAPCDGCNEAPQIVDAPGAPGNHDVNVPREVVIQR